MPRQASWTETFSRQQRVKVCKYVMQQLTEHYEESTHRELKDKTRRFESLCFNKARTEAHYFVLIEQGLSKLFDTFDTLSSSANSNAGNNNQGARQTTSRNEEFPERHVMEIYLGLVLRDLWTEESEHQIKFRAAARETLAFTTASGTTEYVENVRDIIDTIQEDIAALQVSQTTSGATEEGEGSEPTYGSSGRTITDDNLEQYSVNTYSVKQEPVLLPNVKEEDSLGDFTASLLLEEPGEDFDDEETETQELQE